MHEHRQSRGYRPLSVCVVAVLLQARVVSVRSTSSACHLPHLLIIYLPRLMRWSLFVGPGKWVGFKLLRGHRETPELDCGPPARLVILTVY